MHKGTVCAMYTYQRIGEVSLGLTEIHSKVSTQRSLQGVLKSNLKQLNIVKCNAKLCKQNTCENNFMEQFVYHIRNFVVELCYVN